VSDKKGDKLNQTNHLIFERLKRAISFVSVIHQQQEEENFP